LLENHNIICFGPSDWWAMNPSCATHIMKRLAQKNKVLYVNPFGSDLLAGVKKKKGLGARITRKLKSLAKYLRHPQNNLHVFSPIFLPIQGKRWIDAMNNLLLKLQLKAICYFLGISKPLLWLENVRAADMMSWFNSSLKLYHVSDLFDDDSYITNRQLQRQREKRICDESDLLICVSKELYDRKQSNRDNVFYAPHGVDFELFQQAAQKNQQPEELADIPRPIAGYFGTLTAYNDIELLLWCAQALPDVSFVLAGQITGGDYSQLKQMNNVHFLGRLPYEKIPQLCAFFDVCLLQWKMSEWIECCNPLKMFEYMASGKPIVSVPIKESMQYCDIISIAHNKEQFADAIRWELQNDTQERSCKRIEIAREHSWDKHVDKISELIETAITAKQNIDPQLAGQSIGEIN
jgi:glycosyltransferase involved in cell wall biosynthesis